MSLPLVISVMAGSPAEQAGVEAGDQIVTIDGQVPRDVIAYQNLVDDADVMLEIRRGNRTLEIEVPKRAGEPLGAQVDAAIFDAVRTCDNHCEFCFIYQLPKGLRKSLYLKDDDYRLSFLYGNYTTLTRFTEIDLERVVTERLSPLNVSIHATDPTVRSDMLRNRRGAMSLRWLRALLDHGIEVHGQVVVCPGLNDGDVLDTTLADVADRYPDLASLCVVPLGVSRYNTEPRMRAHTVAEAQAVLDTVHTWRAVFEETIGQPLVHAADEYYLLAGRPFPSAESYRGFPMHEDGVGMARAFELELLGDVSAPLSAQPGFFAWADASPGTDYRPADRAGDGGVAIALRPRRGHERRPADTVDTGPIPVGILTGPLGALVLQPLVARLGLDHVRVIEVSNEFFGGNVGVTGLMVGEDLSRILATEPEGHRYLLPDVCLNQGRFLDGTVPSDLPRPVEVLPADGVALRRALGLDRSVAA